MGPGGGGGQGAGREGGAKGTPVCHHHRRRNRQKKRQRSSLFLGGQHWFNSLRLAIFRQVDLKKRMDRITATWQNVCYDKMADSHHPPSQTWCSPKIFSSNILTAKWLVQHSSTSPNQQPLPSLLYLSFFYGHHHPNLITQKLFNIRILSIYCLSFIIKITK